MDARKRRRVESAGFKVGTAAEFLGLTEAESRYVDLKLALARQLARRRNELGLTQVQLARRLESSQSRVAKMEAGDASVSIDLLVTALLAMGLGWQALADTVRKAALKPSRTANRIAPRRSARRAHGRRPRATRIWFDAGLMHLELADGRVVHARYDRFPRLATASHAQRGAWELIGHGVGIHWPEIHEDLSTEGLLRDAMSVSAPPEAAG